VADIVYILAVIIGGAGIIGLVHWLTAFRLVMVIIFCFGLTVSAFTAAFMAAWLHSAALWPWALAGALVWCLLMASAFAAPFASSGRRLPS